MAFVNFKIILSGEDEKVKYGFTKSFPQLKNSRKTILTILVK